jgi:neutrophil factor 2
VSLQSLLSRAQNLLTGRNYTQLGLAHTIHSAEILYNLGLTKIYLGQIAAGMIDLRKAQEEKSEPDHEVIGDCIRDHGRGYNVFSVPVSQTYLDHLVGITYADKQTGLLFRPSESKLKNIKTRDYMGKAVRVLPFVFHNTFNTTSSSARADTRSSSQPPTRATNSPHSPE